MTTLYACAKWILVAVVFSMQIFPCSAREYPMIRYTHLDGLPSNTVYDVFQEENGYLWFATTAGVSRYNGQRFENFSINDGLPDNECFFFRKDQHGRLWIAMYNGELAFFRDGIFHTARNTPFLRLPIRGNTIWNIKVYPDSSVSFSLGNIPALIVIRGDSSRMIQIPAHRTIPALGTTLAASGIADIRLAGRNRVEVICKNARVVLDMEGNILSAVRMDGAAVRWLCSNPQGEFYAADSLVYDSELKPFIALPQKVRSNTIFKVSRYPEGIFTSTADGLWVGTDKMLSNIPVTNVLKDRDGHFWITTMGHGVYKLSRDFSHSVLFRNAYGMSVIYAGSAPRGTVFCTQDMNMYRCDSAVTRLADNSRYTGERYRHTKWGCFSDGRYFLTTAALRNRLVDLATNAVSVPSLSASHPQNTYVFCLERYLYFVARDTVYRLHYDTLLAGRRPAISGIDFGADRGGLYTYSIAQAADSAIWLSTNKGMYRIAGSEAVRQDQFRDVYLRKFAFTRYGLAGYTLGNELIVCTPATAVPVRSLRGQKGIWNNFYPLSDSSLIIVTNTDYRLIVMSGSGASFRFSIRVLDNQFLPQQADYLFAGSGYCYFFKDRNIYKFPLWDILSEQSLPRLFFRSVKCNPGKTIRVGSQSVRLPFGQSRDISISFAAIATGAPVARYEYCIVPQGDHTPRWVSTGDEFISLHNINAGAYRVRVRAKTVGGRYSEEAELLLDIGKPWWLSWWFPALALLCFAMLTGLLVRWYLRRASRKKDQELRFLKSEFKALNALMNPHFIFNALGSIQNLVKKDRKEAAISYIHTFSHLVRQNMQNISQDLIPLEKELVLVRNYLELEKLRFKNRLGYELLVEDEVETEDILIPPLLVQPLVENAVKHGLRTLETGQGFIRIRIFESEGMIVAEVTDNGPGFGKQEGGGDHLSMAIGNIRERLNKLSALHRLKIELEIAEWKKEDGTPGGVKSVLRIHA